MGRKEKAPLNEHTLGARLRQARTEAGLSLSEMAGRLGYTRSHLSGVENDVGKPSQELLAKYAELVGRSVEDLTGVPAVAPSPMLAVASPSAIGLLQPINSGWSEGLAAPSFGRFYDREDELKELKAWVVDARCRIVAVFGRAGIGKSALAAKLYNQVADQFDECVWFTLTPDAPPSLVEVLKKAITTFSPQQQIAAVPTEDGLIVQLLNCMNERRCLMVLDGVDAVLQNGSASGEFKKGYSGYRKLLGMHTHQSCLLLTSSEQLKEVQRLARRDSPVRMQILEKLDIHQAMPILLEQELQGSQEAYERLIKLSEGNPSVLRLIGTSIATLFSNKIDLFFSQADHHSIFGDLRAFYRKQIDRLSDGEAEIIYWLAVEREGATVEQLHKDLMRPPLKGDLFELLASLQRRFMIALTPDGAFTLHPAIMEYAIDSLVEHIYLEIEKEEIDWLARYALIQAQARDYIREEQEKLILQPLVEQLRGTFGERILEEKLKRLLAILRDSYKGTPGYAAGNILDILTHLDIDLKSFDFSTLLIRQAYLQQKQLREVNFRAATFEGSAFSDTFGNVLSVTFSPDTSLLAAGTSRNEIRLWHTQDFTPLRTFYGHQGWVWALAFSPDGQYLVSGSEDGTVRIWDVKSGQNVQTLAGYKGWIRAVTYHQDGYMFAYGGDEGTIKLWSISGGETGPILQEYGTLEGHTSWIRTLAFSPDGKRLASGSEDQTICIWDLGTKECVNTLRGHQNRVRSLSFSHDGTLLASCGEDSYVCLWDMRDRGNAHPILFQPGGEKTMLISVVFNPREKTFATGEDSGRILYWDVNNTGQPIARLIAHLNRIRPLAFSNDGTLLASGSEDQTLRLWDMKKKKKQCIKTFRGYSNWMWSVTFGRNANTVFTGGEDNSVGLWNVSEGRLLKTMTGHTQRIWSVAYSHQMDIIASGSEDKTIRLWRASTGQYLKTLLGHKHRVRSVAFNETGRVLASGSEDQTIRLWDVTTGDSLGVLEGHDRMIWGIACSKKGHLIASGSADQTVRLWDAESKDCIHILEGHVGAVRALAFNDDTSLVASGGDDHFIYLWDVKSGRRRSTLDDHTDRIYSLAFSPDGRKLASGSHDQTVRIWEVSTGICQHVLYKHTGHVWSVAFSDDGESLVSCSEDGTIRVWNVNDGTNTQTMRSPRPYEGMQIAGVKGLTEPQKNILLELGAKEGDLSA